MINRNPRAARRAARSPAALLALVGALVGRAPLSAQSAAPSATLSADSVEVAEVFELRVRVPVPRGSVVYFPDTLPSTPSLESFAPVRWRAERGPERGATLTLTYPLIPFGEGTVVVPGLDVVTLPAGDDAEGERIPGGSLVARWDEVPVAVRYTESIPDRQVWVELVHTSADIMRGVSPRPPSDVVGLSWSLPSVALLLLFTTVIGGAVVTSARSWLAARPAAPEEPPPPPPTLEQARLHALAEIDRLIAGGPHAEERSRELYSASSGIVRGYAERLDPDWGPDLTSTELMARLDGRERAGPALLSEMGTAEAVKFGRARFGPPAIEAHLRALRAWLGEAGEARS
ncbi:MAG TPA: hypothetical protein VLA09_00375 [Longimicrobiales bacterium]|nr:hypothetical protein [Longimicrobiales bacterium]